MPRSSYAIVLGLVLLTLGLRASAATAYVNAWWWSGSEFEFGTRYVSEDRFVDPPPKGAVSRTIDLHRGYVIPPFADAHNHMAGRTRVVSDQALASGIFYLMNPSILASSAPGVRAALEGPGKIDAVLSMGGITAPGGHPTGLYENLIRMKVYPKLRPQDLVGDAFHDVSAPQDIDPVLDRLVAQHAQFVKIFLLFSEEFQKRKDDPAYGEIKGLDPALVPAIVRAAHRRGLRVAAHIETAADFRVIVAAGADESAHMPGYYAGTGPVSDYVITEADALAAAQAHIVVVATASYALNNKDSARLAAVQVMQRSNLLKLKAAGVPILIGTDGVANAAISEARYLIDLGVFSPREALISLSESTPRYIFPKRRLGALRPGFEASFLVLKGDPTLDFSAVKTITVSVKQGFDLAGA